MEKASPQSFFKACKSYLKLVKEYRGISYDAMNAHFAIVFARYMMPSVAQFENENDKTICELCFCLFVQYLPEYMQETLERRETAT